MNKLFLLRIEALEARIAPAAAIFELSSLNGGNGFKLNGVEFRDYAGSSVSDAGDVNGDGFGDVIVGAPGADPNGGFSGASYVVFGKAQGFAASLNLSALDGSNGFKLSGGAQFDYAGGSVSAAGDVNGDGFGDLLIGARRAGSNGPQSGASYVVFGKANGFAANLNLSTLNGSNGFKMSGAVSYDRSGGSVSAAGDFNGDGFDDLIIGAYQANPNGLDSGAAYLVFGKASGFTANLNLSTLSGSNGFKLNGAVAADYAGRSVSTAGDINNDGFDDIIIGAPGADPNADGAGAAYVVFGKASGFAASLNLSTLNGANGFKLNGLTQRAHLGFSVSASGDVNGDGFGDFVISAYGASANGANSGASYVIFGKASAFEASVNLSTLNGSNGFTLSGSQGTRSGYSVSGAGDFNGDGFDDLIIGQSSSYSVTYGASYVVFGKANGFTASLNLATLNGNNGLKLKGAAYDDRSGSAVSAAGDVNGDGFDDLIVGAREAAINGVRTGAGYVVFGSSLGPLPGLSVSDAAGIEPLNGSAMLSFTVTLSSPSAQAVTVEYATADGSAIAPADYTAKSASTLTFLPGEVSKTVLISINANAPREPDETFFLNLTNPTHATLSDAQGVGTIFDKSAPFQLSTLNGSNGFRINGVTADDQAGFSVKDAGDVNGDGFGDLIIGSPRADPHGVDSGASYVVFGKRTGFLTNLNLSTLNGSNGFKLYGAAAGDYTGQSVSSAGDVNGDGFDDLIVGSAGTDSNGYGSGASYVVFGKAAGFPAILNFSSLNGENGFRLSGLGLEHIGASVSNAGDVNGDGFDDLLIGAPRASAAANNSGAVYVLFGKASGFAADFIVSTLNGSNGFKLSGVAASDYAGRSVSAAGDVNGDGFGDILIGASSANPNDNDSGATYVVFGKAAAFAPNVNLSTLDGINGFRLNGKARYDNSGYSVSAAGDINGDGFGDVIIGALRADPNGSESGASYVVFGKAAGFAASLNLSALDGTDGFKLSGVAQSERSGRSVSRAGDFNGDGFDDIVIGADYASPNGTKSGAGYVVFGKATAFAANLNLSALNGSNGFTLSGAKEFDYAGASVSAAGDVNGDGFGDLIIGARGADPNGAGSGISYVVFGHGVELSVGNAVVVEGDAGTRTLQFTVSLSESGEIPVSVKVATLNGSALAGSDFAALAPETIAFAPGETTKTVSVNALGDALFEGDEFFFLALSEAKGGVIRSNAAMGTIQNDDLPPLANITGGAILEGSNGTSSLTFTASLSAPSGLRSSVLFTSVDGTAIAGSDYAALIPGLLTFEPGELTKTISVEVHGDVEIEDHETFSVALSEASGVTIGNGIATGTILNDDTAIQIGDSGSVIEGNSGTQPLVFKVTLEKASALPVSVNFMGFDGTAAAGSDYTALTAGTLTFAPGETTKLLTVAVHGDLDIEEHESFSVLLADAANATIVRAAASGTILNDDTAIEISGVTALEGNSGATPFHFFVTLKQPSALPVTVTYATMEGTANAGIDFDAPPADSQITFAPGEVTKSVTINVLGDLAIETHETFSVMLSGAAGAAIAQAVATGTILNDDTQVRITDASLLEGHHGSRVLAFTVSLSAASGLSVSAGFSSSDGSATSGIDYSPLLAGVLDFAPGETSKTLTVDLLGDTMVEASETFSILLSNAVNAVIADDTGLGTILDDDVTLLSPHKASFTDVDGELVTITSSRGTLNVENFTIFPSGFGAQLALVDFSNKPEFAGTNLSIVAKSPRNVAVGDHLVHVGYINATGITLGKVSIKGDLGQIDAGDPLALKTGLLSLTAQSFGKWGLLTQLPGGSLQSDIEGGLKSLKLTEGLRNAALLVNGDIGLVMIKGDMRDSSIRSGGRIGAVKIGGDLAADTASTISALGMLAPSSAGKAVAIASLKIGGFVDHAQVLAGYDLNGAALNGEARIGAVSVGANWSASNLVAGVLSGGDGQFGTDDDAPISPGGGIVSRIASILIKGTASGGTNQQDRFGFVSMEIGSIKTGGMKLPLTPGAGNDLHGQPVGLSGSLLVREVAPITSLP